MSILTENFDMLVNKRKTVSLFNSLNHIEEEDPENLDKIPSSYNMSAFNMRGLEQEALIRFFGLCEIPHFEYQPVFIVGCPRSGTSLLGLIISQYQGIFVLHEPREAWFNAIPQTDIWSSRAEEPRKGKLYFEKDSAIVTLGQIDHIKDIFEVILKCLMQRA